MLIGPPVAQDVYASESRPLGRLREVRETLAAFNTSEDGSGSEHAPTLRLHGPGLTLEVATSADPVTQAMASINDESIAWPVLERICRSLRWRLMDMESGRVMAWQ